MKTYQVQAGDDSFTVEGDSFETTDGVLKIKRTRTFVRTRMDAPSGEELGTVTNAETIFVAAPSKWSYILVLKAAAVDA
jgi:hypothetical protein